MQPKPLSKEERDFIPMLIETCRQEGLLAYAGWISKLADAEQFWREAVKRIDPSQNYHAMCQWCEAEVYSEPHKPGGDCPWLLAQEE